MAQERKGTTTTPPDLRRLLATISELVSESCLMDAVREIWSSDRFFTYSAFKQTAKKVVSRLRSWDVKARTFEVPADGRTVFGDWKMPLGWDCRGARLEIYDPFEERGTVLADAAKQPTGVVMWSGPTPPEGITAEIVRVENAAELTEKRKKVIGKIVYTSADPRGFKRALAEFGALAVVTSFSPVAARRPKAQAWLNGWSDNPGGWAFHAEDTPFPGMVISPEDGVKLEVLLERGPVKLKMKIDTEYREDILPLPCGYLDGSLQEEVLALGHVMEQGANDNASGAAVIMESLRVLRRSTADGKLPPLRRGVRGLLVSECYGTIGFAVLNSGIMRRITAAVNWDTVGRHRESDGAMFRRYHCPDASASVADTLLDLLLDTWLPEAAPYVVMQQPKPFSLTDNVFCDPAFGIPCPYVDSQDDVWHTSADDLSGISPRTLRAFAAVSAAYLYFLSTAGLKEAVWLARQTVRRYGRRMEDAACEYELKLDAAADEKVRAAILARAHDHLDYLRLVGERAVRSAKGLLLRAERAQGHLALLKVQRHLKRLADLEKRRLKDTAGCAPSDLPKRNNLDEWAELRPLRKFVGTPTYANISPAEREEAGVSSPMWISQLHAALFYADGTKTMAEIAKYIEYEYGRARDAELLRHFRFMGEHDMLQWLKPGEEIPKAKKTPVGVAAVAAQRKAEKGTAGAG